MRLPGANDSSSAAPGAGPASEPTPWTDPDDHLVEPETRQEMWRGQLIELAPARPEHGDTHTRLDRVIDQYTASGYIASTDLLTRRSEDSDFATDTSVRKDGDDPETGNRYLEELSFEIFHTQSRTYATRRARDIIASGVRRLFGLFVCPSSSGRAGSVDDDSSSDPALDQPGDKAHRFTVTVEEWSPEQDTWLPRDTAGYIHDPCLVRPLAIRALLDAAAADNACAHALIARRNPVIEKLQRTHRVKGYRKGEETGYRKGKDDGYLAGKDDGYLAGKDDGIKAGARSLASSLLTQHFGELPDWASQRIAAAEFDEIQRWMTRVLAAVSLEELLGNEHLGEPTSPMTDGDR